MALGGRIAGTRAARALVPLALALCAAAAPAQSLAGSETRVLLPHALVGGGGTAASETVVIESGLGQAAAGALATSPGFALAPGVAWSVPGQSFDAPLVFGTSSGRGDRLGNELQTVFGFNLAAPGAGTTDVLFGGVAGANTQVVSNLVATTTSPMGVNEHENPLGASRLAITNAVGSHGEPARFVYTPALVSTTAEPGLGSNVTLRYYGPAPTVWVLAIGFGSPGASVPIQHFTGSAELLASIMFLVTDGFAPAGEDRRTFPLVNPNLAGLTLELQSIAIVSFFAQPYGSFTNRLEVFVNP